MRAKKRRKENFGDYVKQPATTINIDVYSLFAGHHFYWLQLIISKNNYWLFPSFSFLQKNSP